MVKDSHTEIWSVNQGMEFHKKTNKNNLFLHNNDSKSLHIVGVQPWLECP